MRASQMAVAGESRICPHCKETILKSSPSCPICHHVLRFVRLGADSDPHPTKCPLLVEGTINHGDNGEPVEYCVLMEVHDETGKVVSRHTVGIGALRRTERRTFSLRVEFFPTTLAS
jgi:hypothetical protein